MRIYFRYQLLVLFFALKVCFVQGQESDQGLRNITEKFSGFCKSVPFEDIYIHSDRDTYIAGEYLWFNTYLFDRQSSSLSSGSSYAYCELLNPDNRPVAQVRIRLVNGTGNGGFTLPDSLSSGEYILRAYTNWMKNFLPDGCFMKTITIHNFFTNRHYKTKEAGSPANYTPPRVFDNGFLLNINNSEPDSLELTLNIAHKEAREDKNYVYLIIQSKGNILYSKKEIISGAGKRIVIPRGKLNPGINQIAIFDAETKPVCDRYVFNPSPAPEKILINSRELYSRRKKIKLEIDLDTNLLLSDTNSNYSLSVSAPEANNRSSDIDDYMIFGNEFMHASRPGPKPAYLRNSPVKEVDDFLLNCKSNWIAWDSIMSDKLPVIKYDFEKNGHYLSGIVKSETNKSIDKKMLLYLSIPGKTAVFRYAEIDSENRFSFFIPDNELSKDLIVQPADIKNSYSLLIESPFSEKYPEQNAITDTSKLSFTEELINLSTNYQVSKIYGISFSHDTIMSHDIKPEPIRFYGKPDQKLRMRDYIVLPVMQEVFFELVPGVTIKADNLKYGIYVEDPLTKEYYDNPPGLFIDGVIVNDPSALINFDPELVEEIDIIKSEYIVGSVLFCGIINVITKAADFVNVPLPSNAVRIASEDHDYSIKFVSPDYSREDKISSRIPDFRNTLFWKPDLKPDKNGKIIIELTSSDFISGYEINFQGTGGGKLVSGKKIIRIE